MHRTGSKGSMSKSRQGTPVGLPPRRPVKKCSCPATGLSRFCDHDSHRKRAEILHTLGFNPLTWMNEMPHECFRFKRANPV